MSDPKRINDINDVELNRYSYHAARPLGVAQPAARAETAGIAEQQPVMRSVAIGPVQNRVIQPELALRRDAPCGLRPLTGLSRSLAERPTASPKERPRKVPLPSVAQVWKVDQDLLQPPSIDFPLVGSSRVVRDTSASVVSARISDCLRSRSIRAKFSKSEPLAKCRNTDFVKFHIRLFIDSDGLLVEVQRLSGDSISFMRDCRAILDASEGRQADLSEPEEPLFFRRPVSTMSFLKNIDKSLSTSGAEAEEAINFTSGLLSSNRSDSNMLGMESLVTLTDTGRTDRATAVLTSKRVLCASKESKSFDIHNCVMSLVIYGNDNDESLLEETAMEDHSLKLRGLAMHSLANSLSLLLQEECLSQTLSPFSSWYTDVLIPSLVNDLDNASDQPFDSCLAARCLSSLSSASYVYARKIRELDGLTALKDAELVGQNEFALLEKDANICHKSVLKCCG